MAILAEGSCHVDKRISTLPGAEAFDTAVIVVKYPGGKTATIDVCRQVRVHIVLVVIYASYKVLIVPVSLVCSPCLD